MPTPAGGRPTTFRTICCAPQRAGHVKCIVFCGTGVASYLNLDKARELKIRVCNAEHYGDHARGRAHLRPIPEI